MKCIIPFESRIKFNGPVKEICSISLEHEITKNSTEVLGNFFITGTYKEYELSINAEDFKFTVPFDVTLERCVDESTIEFNIDNFTYELDGSDLIVKIDYEICAEDKKIEDPLDLIVEEKEEVKEDVRSEDVPLNVVDNMLLEDDYITYHVHKVKMDETIDIIAKNYNADKDDILKINNISEIYENDTLLIPINNE